MRGDNIMPAEKFAELMNVSLAYLSKYNARVIQRAEKEKGLLVRKEGRGKAARYIVEPLSKKEKEIEKSLFEYGGVEVDIEKEWIKYEALKFKIMLLLMLRPENTFYEGTLEEVAAAIGYAIEEVKDNGHKAKKIREVQAAIKALHNEEVIIAYYDDKQKKAKKWVLFIRPSAKEDLIPIKADGIAHIKQLCNSGAIAVKWENFLKVWLALKVFRQSDKEGFTYKEIEDMTGLSKTPIVRILSYMADNNILSISRNIKFIKESKSFVNMGSKATHHTFDFNLI